MRQREYEPIVQKRSYERTIFDDIDPNLPYEYSDKQNKVLDDALEYYDEQYGPYGKNRIENSWQRPAMISSGIFTLVVSAIAISLAVVASPLLLPISLTSLVIGIFSTFAIAKSRYDIARHKKSDFIGDLQRDVETIFDELQTPEQAKALAEAKVLRNTISYPPHLAVPLAATGGKKAALKSAQSLGILSKRKIAPSHLDSLLKDFDDAHTRRGRIIGGSRSYAEDFYDLVIKARAQRGDNITKDELKHVLFGKQRNGKDVRGGGLNFKNMDEDERREVFEIIVNAGKLSDPVIAANAVIKISKIFDDEVQSDEVGFGNSVFHMDKDELDDYLEKQEDIVKANAELRAVKSRIYRAAPFDKVALEHTKKALEKKITHAKNILAGYDPDYENSYNNNGKAYKSKKSYDKAEKTAKLSAKATLALKFLDVAKRSSGNKDYLKALADEAYPQSAIGNMKFNEAIAAGFENPKHLTDIEKILKSARSVFAAIDKLPLPDDRAQKYIMNKMFKYLENKDDVTLSDSLKTIVDKKQREQLVSNSIREIINEYMSQNSIDIDQSALDLAMLAISDNKAKLISKAKTLAKDGSNDAKMAASIVLLSKDAGRDPTRYAGNILASSILGDNIERGFKGASTVELLSVSNKIENAQKGLSSSRKQTQLETQIRKLAEQDDEILPDIIDKIVGKLNLSSSVAANMEKAVSAAADTMVAQRAVEFVTRASAKIKEPINGRDVLEVAVKAIMQATGKGYVSDGKINDILRLIERDIPKMNDKEIKSFLIKTADDEVKTAKKNVEDIKNDIANKKAQYEKAETNLKDAKENALGLSEDKRNKEFIDGKIKELNEEVAKALEDRKKYHKDNDDEKELYDLYDRRFEEKTADLKKYKNLLDKLDEINKTIDDSEEIIRKYDDNKKLLETEESSLEKAIKQQEEVNDKDKLQGKIEEFKKGNMDASLKKFAKQQDEYYKMQTRLDKLRDDDVLHKDLSQLPPVFTKLIFGDTKIQDMIKKLGKAVDPIAVKEAKNYIANIVMKATTQLSDGEIQVIAGIAKGEDLSNVNTKDNKKAGKAKNIAMKKNTMVGKMKAVVSSSLSDAMLKLRKDLTSDGVAPEEAAQVIFEKVQTADKSFDKKIQRAKVDILEIATSILRTTSKMEPQKLLAGQNKDAIEFIESGDIYTRFGTILSAVGNADLGPKVVEALEKLLASMAKVGKDAVPNQSKAYLIEKFIEDVGGDEFDIIEFAKVFRSAAGMDTFDMPFMPPPPNFGDDFGGYYGSSSGGGSRLTQKSPVVERLDDQIAHLQDRDLAHRLKFELEYGRDDGQGIYDVLQEIAQYGSNADKAALPALQDSISKTNPGFASKILEERNFNGNHNSVFDPGKF